jgi:hypothetical protein
MILLLSFSAGYAVAVHGGNPDWEPGESNDDPGDVKRSFQIPGGSQPNYGTMGLGYMRTTGNLWGVQNDTDPAYFYEMDTDGNLVSEGNCTHAGYNLGVACDDDYIYVYDWWNGTGVHVYDQSRVEQYSFTTTAGGNGRGLAWDHNRDLLIVTNCSTGDILWYTSDGTYVDQCSVAGYMEWHMGTAYDECNDIIICIDNSSANDINLFDGETCEFIDDFAHPNASNIPEGAAWTADEEGVFCVAFYSDTCHLVDTGFTCGPIGLGMTQYHDIVVAGGDLSFTAKLSNNTESAISATLSISLDSGPFDTIDTVSIPASSSVNYNVAWPVGSTVGDHTGQLKMEGAGDTVLKDFAFEIVKDGVVTN